MRTKRILSILIFSLLALLLILTVLNFNSPIALAQNDLPGVLLQDTTPTPLAQERGTEAGSTDGILVMGFVIVLIIVLPLAFRKAK